MKKAKAYQCYNARLNDGFSEDELLTAASKYAEECRKRKTDERYIKLGSTFLGAELFIIMCLLAVIWQQICEKKGGTDEQN